MKRYILPKNKGKPAFYWEGKHPVYFLEHGPGKTPQTYLLKNYKALAVCKSFTTGLQPESLQGIYEELIFLHGLLSPGGFLYICGSSLHNIKALVLEVFGEDCNLMCVAE